MSIAKTLTSMIAGVIVGLLTFAVMTSLGAPYLAAMIGVVLAAMLTGAIIGAIDF